MRNKDKYPGPYLYEEYAEREFESIVHYYCEPELELEPEPLPLYYLPPQDDLPPKKLTSKMADA